MKVKVIYQWIENLPIKTRLLYGYLGTFLLVMVGFSTIFYFYFSAVTERNIERKLSSRNVFFKEMIETSVRTAIKDHLRTVAEKNLDILIGIYQKDLSEKEAKKRAADILVSQSVGKTGYLYVVNSLGVITVHPDRQQLDKTLSSDTLRHPQTDKKEGYLHYDWVPPEGGPHRKIITYMTYFGPWDWILRASFFEDEFKELINIDDLQSSMLSESVAKSGYSYVIENTGKLVIHPYLAGKNIFNYEDSRGRKFVREMCEAKKGKIKYSWQDPGELEPRKALAYYDYIADLEWIVVSSAYIDDYSRPLKTLRILIFISLITTLLFVSYLTLQISKTITKPIKYLTAGFSAAANGDFSTRLSPRTTDELGRLESSFNDFITQVQVSNARLHESEKGYRSIFENSLEGIFQFDMAGTILKVNPFFVAMLGFDSSQAILEEGINLQRDLLVRKELWTELLEQVIGNRAVKGLELQLYKKSKSVFWCLLNARAIYEEDSDRILLIEGFLSDINEKKEAQEAREMLMVDLETMVNNRTMELSRRIAELEQRDQLNRFMREMGGMLQSCRSIEETFPVIKQYLKLLFPKDQCTLYIHDSSKKMIDRVIPSPTEATPFISMTNDSCWALRQGKIYMFTQFMDTALTCDHVEKAPHGYICIPLIAQGETMGLLHIVFSEIDDANGNGDAALQLERKKRLCSRLADHLSLALANLSLQEKLKLKSIQDSLTGLANRRHMEEILQRQFFRMLRHNTPCSIIMLDVDHFKKFNDTYGHDMGDCILKELGRYLKEKSRGEDLACRYGGEEFIIILAGTDIEQAAKKAEKVRAEIAETIAIPFLSEFLHVTVSVGVATSPTHGRSVNELLKSADKALYLAKEKGRNRVEIAS